MSNIIVYMSNIVYMSFYLNKTGDSVVIVCVIT